MEENKKTERELLELVGRFFKERNINLIRPYLHSNITYSNTFVKANIKGTTKFLQYFKEEFTSPAAFNLEMDYSIPSSLISEPDYLFLQQKDENDINFLVMVEFKQGKIYSMNYSPIYITRRKLSDS